jgi:hypothetical protein
MGRARYRDGGFTENNINGLRSAMVMGGDVIWVGGKVGASMVAWLCVFMLTTLFTI